jgi:hypothetical protein
MVSMVIFAIGALSLAALIPLGAHRITDSGELSRASALASERAEFLLGMPYNSADLTAGTHVDADNPHDGVYHIRWTVEEDQPIPFVKRITVSTHRPLLISPAVAQVVIAVTESGN